MKFTEVLRGYIPLSDKELAKIWEMADFCLDTNVLLNVYRYSDASRAGFLSLLKQIQPRLFVPHRVAHEFARNRVAVICDHYKQLKKRIEQVVGDLTKDLSRYPELADLQQAITVAQNTINEKFDDADGKQAKLISDDTILRELLDAIGDNVGDPSPRIDEEYNKRKISETPPYCEKDDKKDEDERKGDVAIWLELMEKYRDTGKPIIFVTDPSVPIIDETTASLVITVEGRR